MTTTPQTQDLPTTSISPIEAYRKKLLIPMFENIPRRLKAGRFYVVWLLKMRGENIGKPLFRARAFNETGTAYFAKSTLPESWSSFPSAVKAYLSGQFDGLGTVFTIERGIIFIDLDHCVDEDGKLLPAAQEIIDLLNSYSEYSPSNEGAHVFIIGTLPPDTQHRFNYKGIDIEIYSSDRYSTLTGHRIPNTPPDLEERQAEIEDFVQRLNAQTNETTVVCVCVCGNRLDGEETGPCTCATRTIESTLTHIDDTSDASGCTDQASPARHEQSDRTETKVIPFRETHVSGNIQQSAASIREEDLPREDQLVLMKARGAKNAPTFNALWEGGDPNRDRRKDKTVSAADFEFINILLYWTNDNEAQAERLFKASRRYRSKHDEISGKKQYTNLQVSIHNAVERRHRVRTPRQPVATAKPETKQADPEEPHEAGQPLGNKQNGKRAPVHQERRFPHDQPWTKVNETPEQRTQKLYGISSRVASQVEDFISNGEQGLYVANVAPGAGKTHAVAELGASHRSGSDPLNIAWIADRLDMINSVPAFSGYRQILGCNKNNCRDGYLLHSYYGESGYNALAVHQRHQFQCKANPGYAGYVQQYNGIGSAVYQLPHVRTHHPAGHLGIIIDELDLTKWLPERTITPSRIQRALKVFTTNSTSDQLLRQVEATITDAMQAKQRLYGRTFFEALDKRCSGQLVQWIEELASDPRNLNTHPWHDLEEDDPDAQILEAMTLAPVVLPHILVALHKEKDQWQQNTDWNSCLRVGPSPQGWALHITERLTFTPGEQGLPSRAILDATADADILSLLFKEQITIERAQIDPPPDTRHIAVRTTPKGIPKRYGKTALTRGVKDGKINHNLKRAIAEARYILDQEDPGGQLRGTTQKVGLISYQGCVDALGEALGIQEHRRLHFWAARGSNDLEDCEILLVIGTPTLAPSTVARMARALWQDDPIPISEEFKADDQGVKHYTDPRMQRLNDHLTRAELTQCAHRSRALRQARTVITFCMGDIDYLPATETITDLPRLTAEGKDASAISRQDERSKLDQAREQIEQDGKTVHMMTVRDLKATAHVSTDAASEYLQEARGLGQEQDGHTHTHTTVVSFVPENANIITLANSGTDLPHNTAPPSVEQTILGYGKATDYVSLVVGDVQIGAGSPAWYRFVWMVGPTQVQRQAVCDFIVQQGASPPSIVG